MGDTGAAFVAMPQIPPRNVTWAKKGKMMHLAKIAFEKLGCLSQVIADIR
jgi:sulfide:quinone oxidoreductase